jgi:hypothetical protein
MKLKITISILACFAGLITLNSFGYPLVQNNVLNSNTWSLKIGEKTLLDWQKNHFGDTVLIKKNKFERSELLKVHQFFCGVMEGNFYTTLVITDSAKKKYIYSQSEESSGIYSASIPLERVFSFSEVNKVIVLQVYLRIYNRSNEFDQSTLIGILKIT